MEGCRADREMWLNVGLRVKEASVPGPGGIHCHGDLKRGYRGDGDERQRHGGRHFWVKA